MKTATQRRAEQWIVTLSGGLKMVYRRFAKRPSSLLLRLIAVTASTSLAALFPQFVFAAPPVNALPTGGQVTSGQTTIGAPQTTPAGTTRMDINQQSAQTIINWQTFNIGSNAQVNFNQPSASAVALNRVAAGNPSEIYGQLTANGQVFLVNPSGVLVGRGGQVNVAAFAASTLDITDQNFLNKNYVFTGGNKGGKVVNEGTIISGLGGYVALLAPEVRNEGLILAQLGTVAIGAGDQVSLQMQGDRLIKMTVSGAAIETLIENKQAIRAPGGQIILSARAASRLTQSVVNNTGVLEANSAADLLGTSQAGRIEVSAPLVTTTGLIQANGVNPGETGGTIALRGDFIGMGGTVSADGHTQGGSVSVVSAATLSRADTVSAKGIGGKGGTITYIAGGQLIENQSSYNDASGLTDGGSISVHANAGVLSSGHYTADGAQGVGGRVDISGASVRLLSAEISAQGETQGGLVRIGGAFQGGAMEGVGNNGVPVPASTTVPVDRFVTRWGSTATIATAEKTFLNDSTTIDVSARSATGSGGTAVVWSNAETTMLGGIRALGGAATATGGTIEISSHENLRYVSLDKVEAGAGGALLLDPRNLTIGNVSDTRSWTLGAIMGAGYSATPANGDVNLGDQFGSAVALNAVGDLMAVGSYQAASFDQATTTVGTVRLYGFTAGTANFSGGALIGTIGKGYSGGSNLDPGVGAGATALQANDGFGYSVSLNAAGDKLAVGSITAPAGNGDGRVDLISFTASSRFLAPTRAATIAGANAAVELFGNGVALNAVGDRLAVGAGNGAGGDGKVYLYTTSTFTSPTLTNSINGPSGTSSLFGQSVAFNGAGDRLAVGASSGDAVYLYSLAGVGMTATQQAVFSTAAPVGARDRQVTNLLSGYQFGGSVALSADGTKLAIGAPGAGA